MIKKKIFTLWNGIWSKNPLENYFKEFNIESYSFYKDYEKILIEDLL